MELDKNFYISLHTLAQKKCAEAIFLFSPVPNYENVKILRVTGFATGFCDTYEIGTIYSFFNFHLKAYIDAKIFPRSIEVVISPNDKNDEILKKVSDTGIVAKPTFNISHLEMYAHVQNRRDSYMMPIYSDENIKQFKMEKNISEAFSERQIREILDKITRRCWDILIIRTLNTEKYPIQKLNVRIGYEHCRDVIVCETYVTYIFKRFNLAELRDTSKSAAIRCAILYFTNANIPIEKIAESELSVEKMSKIVFAI